MSAFQRIDHYLQCRVGTQPPHASGCKKNGNWRMVFTFSGEDAVLVDYRDYH